MHSRSRGAQISVLGKKVLSLETLDREKDAKIKTQDAKIKQLEHRLYTCVLGKYTCIQAMLV